VATFASSTLRRRGEALPPPPAEAETPADQRAESTVLIGAFFLVFTYVFLANAWLGDDAYITFRVVDNFVNGYGLTFNPDERVQAYTHPLWMFLLSAAYLVTSDLFYTTLAISLALCAMALGTVFRRLQSLWRSALFLGLLLSSKAFIDYTSSGLEYPLSFLLLAIFYCRFFLVARTAGAISPTELIGLGFIASLAFLNRSDAILLYAGPLLYLAVIAWPVYRARLFMFFGAAFAPAILWLLFSYVYYGFPFPNTYYAKVATGIPRSLQLRQGMAYVANSINFDPFTLGLIGLASAVAIRVRRLPEIAAIASALLYVVYTISVGGDFMSGRFFAMPLFIAAMVIVWIVTRREMALILGAGLIAYNIIAPLAPIKTRASYDGAWAWRLQNGVKDERGHYHQITNVLFYAPFRTLPDHVWFREGISFRNSPEKASVQGSIGFFGFNAGPSKYVIDRNALSDPLLARLPVSESLYFEFYSGHFFRELPDGYFESRQQGKNLIVDPLIHEYYDKLMNVTAGPIFSGSRMGNIWDLNFGRYRRIHEMVTARRPVSVSVPADNERFSSDVGIRNTRGDGVLAASGRAGYLQMGPNMPLKAGHFRARWIGTLNAAASGQHIGYVEVWDDGRQIARRAVHAGEFASDPKVLAEIGFALKDATADLEYRLWVERNVKMILERVNLESISLPDAADASR
jgi:arabinofuranosyltransferase